MKKLAYILSLVAAAAFTVVSCEKEPEAHPFGPAETAGCYGVFFPSQEASGSHVYSPVEDPSIDIIVKRTNTNGAITVPVKATFSEDGIFTMNEVSFADGQDETSFTLRFDNAQEGVNYTASFTVEDSNYASLYNDGPISLDFSVMRVEMKYFMDPVTKEKALVTFNQGWWGEVATGYIKYYEVDNVRTCFTETVDHLYNGTLTVAPGFWGQGEEYEWTFYWYPKEAHPTVEGATMIKLPWQPSGYVHSSVGMVYLGDWVCEQNFWAGTDKYDWMTEAKSTAKFIPSYYDGNGGFYFNVYAYANEAASGWAADPFETVGVASGFVRVDYSLELIADYSTSGVTPIDVEAGADVAYIKYAVYEGELTATQIGYKEEAIISGADASEKFSDFEFDEEELVNTATLLLEPEATGMYTVVAIAYDEKDNAQASANAIFKHVAAGDVDEYSVKLNVFTEDTPARYTSYHNYDSFAYGVSGEDLTDVHIAILKYADVAKNPSAAFAAVKADEKGTYAVTADILAQVNGEGGYYTVATKQPAKTDLMVLVWATNGDMDAYDYAFYTTARLPYKWNSLGTGVYTEDVIGGLYEIGPIDVECNVYEEATTPGLYMIDGFQENYIATLFEVDATDLEGYYWRNCELVIDATNPKSVFIELQDYGICVNSDDGFIDGLTSMYNGKPFSEGVLEDGVISFPKAKGLLCTIEGDGYYYANQDGAFKVVLPAAAASAPKVSNTGKRSIESLSYSSFFKKMETEVFERDPQPIKVNVTVSHDHQSKEHKGIEHRIITLK